MTPQMILGIDPGQSGAIALLADGVFAGFIDMPVCAREDFGKEVDVDQLQKRLRGLRMEHRGAYIFAVVERVAAWRPTDAKKQTGTASFALGRADGQLDATLKCAGIPILRVHPATWKAYMGLTGKGKDASLALARARHPGAREYLTRKKDDGRAEAALIATWARLTEQVAAA